MKSRRSQKAPVHFERHHRRHNPKAAEETLPALIPGGSQQERAQACVQVQKALHEANRYRLNHPHDEMAIAAWRQAVAVFDQALRAAYMPGFWEDFERLRAGDATALESQVAFLEADPWFFGSGYVKADLIRFLNRLELSPACVERLRKVVLNVIDQGDGRRELRSYCRLARKVDSPELRRELEKRIEYGANFRIRSYARWALDACEKLG